MRIGRQLPPLPLFMALREREMEMNVLPRSHVSNELVARPIDTILEFQDSKVWEGFVVCINAL